MAKICPKCNREWPDEFMACPMDQTPLITKKQQTDGINLQLGDANAISGGINVSDNRTVNTVNTTTNNIDSHNIINNITHVERNKSSEELLHEKKLAYRKACMEAFSNGVLSSNESRKLEEYRSTLGLDNGIAKQILVDVRSKLSRKGEALGPVQQIVFDKIKTAISQNQLNVVSRLFPEFEAIAQSHFNEDVLFTYYMLIAVLHPADCIKSFETRIEDSYWQTFWVSIAYKKISKSGEAMKASAELRYKWKDTMPQENEFILAAANNVLENDWDSAKIYFTNVEGTHSSELSDLTNSLYTILSPDFKCKDIFCDYYLNHLFANKETFKDGSTKEGINIGKHFIGIVKNPDGCKREGKFLENILIDGCIWYTNGQKYEGKFNKEGYRHGYGTYTWPSGEVYEGEWRNGKREGQGKDTYADGRIYEGEWKNDWREGRGIFTWPSGEVYEGEWKNDKREGQGKDSYVDGRIYEGEWENDKHEGQGKMTFPGGCIYNGEWKNGKREGRGTYIWPNGDVYEGEWKNDKREGQGKKISSDGCIYEGEWKNDEKKGQGKMTSPDGEVWVGYWKNDKMEGKMTSPGGSVFEGHFKNGAMEGYGKMTSPDGRVYESEWKKGEIKSQGKIIYPDGGVYEGEWSYEEGEKEGQGKMTYSDGRVYEGNWKNDKMEGYGKMTFSEGLLNEDGKVITPSIDYKNYKFPTLSLLKKYDRDSKPYIDKEELIANKKRIVEVLNSFGVQIREIKATVGPTITLYEITPAEGVRISKIRNLEDDIALLLAAPGIRIIAPIPGKGTIGIDVPNAHPSIVSMESILNSRKFQESQMELPIALGKTITNEVFMVDLAKQPHLLVAGATGQGKSVGLNAIITSLLYKKHPNELKIVLVDPKKVEFSVYEPIADHFMAVVDEDEEPIITDVTKVVRTLKSLCALMDKRYDMLKMAGARNIKEYNQKYLNHQLNPENGHEFMPYVVVIIDEFGDLIMTAGKEVELPIARIAQLARAVGIHLIIATQRPTTTIITGNIKANFPVRIAFRLGTMIDSRTILDRPGANQLVGRGDMLFLNGQEPVRVQCAFVDIPEVEQIAKHIAQQPGPLAPFKLPKHVSENGQGKMTYPDGRIYEGNWKNDKMEGQGKMTFSDGKIYDGEWKNDKRDGLGKITYPNGCVYEGNWKNDMREGQGKMNYPDGHIYVGNWKNNKKEGYGRMIIPKKLFSSLGVVEYEGEWKNGKMEGQGKMIYPDGDVYEGEWKNCQREGYGRITCTDGCVLEGNWKNDQMEGYCKMISPDGDVFEGNCKNDKRDGYGKITSPDGSFFEGNWKNDQMEGHCKIISPDRGVYEGDCKNNKREGHGKMTWPSGDSYEGEWKNDKRNGQGIMTYSDGRVYEGHWENDIPNGHGCMTYPDGHVDEGRWKNGKLKNNKSFFKKLFG